MLAVQQLAQLCREWVTKAKQSTPAYYLTLAAAPVAPPHQALIVFVLLGQVVIEDTLCYCLPLQE